MIKHVFLLVLLWTFMSEILHGRADKRTIVRGGLMTPTFPSRDFFSYSNNDLCGNSDGSEVHKWCGHKNAEQPNQVVTNADRCSCLCKYNYLTFLPQEQKCMNESSLKSKFGEGTYFISDRNYLIIDFDGATNTISTRKNSKGCQIKSVKYYFNGSWKSDVTKWSISINGVISWGKSSNRSEMKGKIIKITLKKCHKDSDWVNQQPIFVKAKGQFSVTLHASSAVVQSTLMVPTLTTVQLPLSTSTSSGISSSALSSLPNTGSCSNTVSVICPSSKTVEYPPTPKPTSTLVPGPTSYVQAGTLTPTSASSSVITSTPTNPGHPQSEGQRSSSPTGAIVGAIIAVIGVVIFIVLIVVWRQQKNKRKEQKKKEIKNSEFEYDYAAMDGDPRASSGQPPGIYQSLTHDGNRESVYTPLDRQQDNPLEESTGYDKIDHPVFQPGRKGPTDPQYNVLQRPNKNKPNQEYLEPGVQIDRNKISSPRQAPQSNEPVYNVLEDPSPGSIADEPEYNVLEDPNGQHDPEYNVLEDPEGQYEPEYNVLEAPDSDHDKGPAKGHPSSHDNVGYASTIALKPRGGSPVYAAPEGPISEPTYQPLTINAPDDSVYQPLDRRSRIVPDDQPVYHVLESATSTDA